MIFMATTEIASVKTAGEIQALLSKHGVTRIQTTYEDGEIAGLDFALEHQGKEIPFSLPVRWKPVLLAMMDDEPRGRYAGTPRHLCTNDQAKRTSWRIILRWIQAQLALIETGQVDMKEVFMPYMIVAKNKTLYQKMSGNNFKQIGHET